MVFFLIKQQSHHHTGFKKKKYPNEYSIDKMESQNRKNKKRNAHGKLVQEKEEESKPIVIKWPLRFDYETGNTYISHMNDHLARKVRYDQGDRSGPPADPRYLRPLDQVAMVMHPAYSSHVDRYMGAKGRGHSYEFFLFPNFESFLQHVYQDTVCKQQNNWYAVVEDNAPVKFYIDFEENCPPEGNRLDLFFRNRVLVGLAFIRACLESIYGVNLERRKPQERWLCASNNEKSSFHLHISQWAFVNIDALSDAMDLALKALEALEKVSPNHLIVQALLSRTPSKDNKWIIDWGVYTPRRKFRMAFQSKVLQSVDSKKYRPLLPWNPSTCQIIETADVQEWLCATGINVRSGNRRRPLLPAPSTAQDLHREIRSICLRDGSTLVDLWRAMQFVKVAYYDSEACINDFNQLKQQIRKRMAARCTCPRQIWNAAVCLLWDSGIDKFDDPQNEDYVVRLDILQPSHKTGSVLLLPASHNHEPFVWMQQLYGLIPWTERAEEERYFSEMDPLAGYDVNHVLAYRGICMRLAYRFAMHQGTNDALCSEKLLCFYPSVKFFTAQRSDWQQDEDCDSDYESRVYRPRLLQQIQREYKHDNIQWGEAKLLYESLGWRKLAADWFNAMPGTALKNKREPALLPPPPSSSTITKLPSTIKHSTPASSVKRAKWVRLSVILPIDSDNDPFYERHMNDGGPHCFPPLVHTFETLYAGTERDPFWAKILRGLSNSCTDSSSLRISSPSGSEIASNGKDTEPIT